MEKTTDFKIPGLRKDVENWLLDLALMRKKRDNGRIGAATIAREILTKQYERTNSRKAHQNEQPAQE